MLNHYVYILLTLFIFSVDLYASTPGKIIILYGTHCGGKSTLADELVKQLPEKYEFIRKSHLLAEKRRDTIEKLTGKRPKRRKDIFEIAMSLPKPYRKKAMGSSSEAIRETLLQIRSRAERGENSIYPDCLKNLEKLKILEGTTFYSVLVYAPLSELSKREIFRTITRQRTPFEQQYRRNEILNSYTKLFGPVKNNKEPFIDTVSYEDLKEFVLESERRGTHHTLELALQHAANHFGVDRYNHVKIAPIEAPDLIINTTDKSPAESARIVVKKIYGSPNTAHKR